MAASVKQEQLGDLLAASEPLEESDDDNDQLPLSETKTMKADRVTSSRSNFTDQVKRVLVAWFQEVHPIVLSPLVYR